MELKDIVAVSGQSGLHKIIGRSKNGLILETIATGKRFATSYQDKVSVLEDISMFTLDGDLHLSKVIVKINEKGSVPSVKDDAKIQRQFLIDAIQLDSERVYDSDIKRLLTWYDTLKNVVDFAKLAEDKTVAENTDTTDTLSEDTKATSSTESKEDKPKKVAATKTTSTKTPKTAAPKNSAPKANSKGAGGSKTTYRPKSV